MNTCPWAGSAVLRGCRTFGAVAQIAGLDRQGWALVASASDAGLGSLLPGAGAM